MTVQPVQANRDVAGSGAPNGYIVKPGDTLSGIAARHGVSLAALERANPQIKIPDLIYPGQHVTLPSGGEASGRSYTVRSGDTLSAIGDRHGVSWQSIASANNLSNPNLIFPGQQLTIPTGGGRPGGGGPVDGPGATAPGGGTPNVAQIAEKYLGQTASSLKGNTSDNLPMNANVPSNLCCANFVSAVLTEAGQLPQNLHTDSVAQLNSTLRSRGWTPVPAGQERAGDVVIIQGGGVSHTEIISGPGQMIGSNNVNADGTQRISRDNLSWALDKGAVILRAPGGGAEEPSGPTGADGPAPTGAGTHAQKIDQAIGFFEGQGWSRAQAIGIVANLDAESNMDHNISQIGGGPGYGLAQWEGPRQASFASWAGHDIRQSTFEEQLRFIQWELTHTESAAGARLREADDPRSAAEIVTRYYERPADTDGEAARRGQRAVDMAR